MSAAEKDFHRTERAALLDELQRAGADVRRPESIRCPFHDDAHASAGVHCDDQGAWRFKCHAASCGWGGDVFDVRARLANKTSGDMLREFNELRVVRPGKPYAPRVYPTLESLAQSVAGCERVFAYADPDTGRNDLVVIRARTESGKTFRQASPCDGGYAMEAPPKPWPLYNRTRLRTTEIVVVVEGEKAVHALAEFGVVATTSPGGAGKAKHADWSPLAGKRVLLWPDNDPPDAKGKRPGFDHMRDVARILDGLADPPSVAWVDVEALDLPPKGDAVEFIAALADGGKEGQKAGLDIILADAVPAGPADGVISRFHDMIAGKFVSVSWPWECLHRATNALLPGTVTCLCGDPGSTKSFLILEAAAHWQEQGIPFAVFELEDDRTYHLMRVLAQRDGNSSLTDPDWVRSNGDAAIVAFDRHREFLDTFGKNIADAPDEQVTHVQLAEWVARKAAQGSRVIVVDPITAVVSEKPWVDDLNFLMAVKATAKRSGCSVVLVTHPKKGSKGNGLHDLAGGAAFQRFAQTVVWVTRLEKSKVVRVRNPAGESSVRINRTVQLQKTRNGSGAGLSLGLYFDGATLRTTEAGVVLPTSPEADDA